MTNLYLHKTRDMRLGSTTRAPPLAPHHLRHRQRQRNPHHHAPERDARVRRVGLPRAALGEVDEAQRGQDVGEGAGGRGPHQLEDDPQVAGEEGDGHGAHDERGREDQVSVRFEGFVGEVVFALQRGFRLVTGGLGLGVEGGLGTDHDFAADEAFKGEGGEHV